MKRLRALLPSFASLFVTSALALGATIGPAAAQEPWPSRAIRLISPFPAGGTSDVMARMVSEALTRELGQPVVVENVGGAGGVIGTLRGVRSAPDGYTLIQTGVGQNAVAHGLEPRPGYDSINDFIHITQVHSGPNVLVAHPSAPFKTFSELLAWVRANPGKLNYGYTLAASGHMAMELLKIEAGKCPPASPGCGGFSIVGVPYRGGGPMLADLLGGTIPMIFINQDVALQHVRSGKLRALAVTSLKRNRLYPDLPTVDESGIAGFQALSWSGLSVPRGTPIAIVERLEATMKRIMSSAPIRERMESVGFVIPEQGSIAYTAFVRAELELWTRVIRTAGIRAE